MLYWDSFILLFYMWWSILFISYNAKQWHITFISTEEIVKGIIWDTVTFIYFYRKLVHIKKNLPLAEPAIQGLFHQNNVTSH